MVDESQWQTPEMHFVPPGQKVPPVPAQPPQFSESELVSVHEALHMICAPGQPLPESEPDDELEEEPPEVVPDDVPEVVPDDVPEDVPDDVPEDVPDDVPVEVPEAVPEEVPVPVMPDEVPDDDPPLPPSAP
jgi:hypothetical protein